MASLIIMAIAAVFVFPLTFFGVLLLVASLWTLLIRRKKSAEICFFSPILPGWRRRRKSLVGWLEEFSEERQRPHRSFHFFSHPALGYIIYTGDDPRKCLDYRDHVMERFSIVLPPGMSVQFVHLASRTLLEAHHYPFATMICQCVGSILVGMEALWKLRPDVFIDTTGHAFTLPLFRLVGACRTAAYVHYPTISTDMLSRVRDRKSAHNNASSVSRSQILTSMKLIYYYIFAVLYGLAGRCCQVVLVNSTWTANHIRTIWQCPSAVVVYPPCNVTKFLTVPLLPDDSKSEFSVVSIGQFRPEKDHALQLEILADFLEKCPGDLRKKVKLHFVGSCRNAGDEERVSALKRLADRLKVSPSVVYHLNAPFSELLKVCEEGTVGLHTMWNEHFGIGVVECMAAGLIIVAHDSGGPKADIVVDWNGGPTGFLGSGRTAFVQALLDVAQMDVNERSELRKRARGSVSRFTDEQFEQEFSTLLASTLSASRK